MEILKIWWFQKYCKSNFVYIFGICVKIECRIFFVIFADSAYSARYCASKFFKNAKNLKKNSQKKSLGEEIWGKRNRHHRENKKWCLGFFNRFLKNWVSTNLQLNENFRNLRVFLTLIGCCKDLCNWFRGKKKKTGFWVCDSNFDYIFEICVKIECGIFFITFANFAYSAR